MFESITDFFNTTTSYSISLPLWVKIGMIIVIITALLAGMYFIKDQFEISYFRSAYFWYFIVAFVNLISILIIVYFYNSKNGTYVGPQGLPGKRGNRGKSGKFLTCNYCKTNLYIQKQDKGDVICQLSIYTPPSFQNSTTLIADNLKYFNGLISSGSIDYSQFVNNIILAKSGDPSASDAVTKFKTLMSPYSLAFQLIDEVNHSIGKADNLNFGSFKRPGTSSGYTILGDSIIGGSESFDLNGFVISGDIMFPQSYNLLVSFKSYNQDTGNQDTYTIWRPIGQSVMEPQQISATSNTNVAVQYGALGDICTFGTAIPPLNTVATIRTSCLEEVSPEYATFVFAYCGEDLNFADETNSIDYTQTTSYLIQNKIANNVQLFSVWRTPLNTFITNSNTDNHVVNNTVAFNIYNNLKFALNENGGLKTIARQYLITFLSTVALDKITVATVFCKHFEVLYARELIYYINKAQISLYGNVAITQSIPTQDLSTLTLNLSPDTSLGDMMSAITATITEFNTYNANIGPTSIGVIPNNTTSNVVSKQLPDDLMNTYNMINSELASLPVQIENANTLLDIINVIFDAGLDTRIAVDSNGIAEGGTMMTEVQELIVRVCKILMPPFAPIYMINDDCLAANPIDNTRQELIRQFTNIVEIHNKYITAQTPDAAAHSNMQQVIRQQEQVLNNEVGQVIGHIDGWYEKLTHLSLDAFTTSRIEIIMLIYQITNTFYSSAFASVNLKTY